MTTKELIQQYVTAHADNRWMDASELEALLTEFAEKLQKPASEDLEQAAIDYDSCRPALYGEDDEGNYVEYIEVRKDAFIAGAEWQKEREFTHIEPTDNGYQAAIHYMQDCQEVDDFARRGIKWIAERYFIQGAKWREKQYLVSKDMEIAFKEYAKREHCECDLETSGEPIQYDSTDDLIDACRYGALLQKEQMMKNAIDAHVNMEWNHLSLSGFAWSQTGLDLGDKCKLIIIKE